MLPCTPIALPACAFNFATPSASSSSISEHWLQPTAQLFAETIARHGIEPALQVHMYRGSAMKSTPDRARRNSLGPPEISEYTGPKERR